MKPFKRRDNLSLLSCLLMLSVAACSPVQEGLGDAPLDLHLTWEEDDNEGNEHPGDAENVDVPWQHSVTVSGTMSECGYDGIDDWPWTGDNDNYRIEIPEEGYIEAVLDWESSSDLDLIIYFEPPGSNANPDWYSNVSNNSGPEEYLFDDPLDRGDDIVVGVACASGASDSYTLVVNWET